MNRNELETLIVKHAWGDDAFRSEFLADPKATIEKYAGERLPAEAKVFAHAEDDTTVHFVIPRKPANADDLSDEDLEKVAGGVDPLSTGLLVGGMVAGLVIGAGSIFGAAAGTRANHGW